MTRLVRRLLVAGLVDGVLAADRMWRGIPGWVGQRIDHAGRWADVTGGDDD